VKTQDKTMTDNANHKQDATSVDSQGDSGITFATICLAMSLQLKTRSISGT